MGWKPKNFLREKEREKNSPRFDRFQARITPSPSSLHVRYLATFCTELCSTLSPSPPSFPPPSLLKTSSICLCSRLDTALKTTWKMDAKRSRGEKKIRRASILPSMFTFTRFNSICVFPSQLWSTYAPLNKLNNSSRVSRSWAGPEFRRFEASISPSKESETRSAFYNFAFLALWTGRNTLFHKIAIIQKRRFHPFRTNSRFLFVRPSCFSSQLSLAVSFKLNWSLPSTGKRAEWFELFHRSGWLQLKSPGAA